MTVSRFCCALEHFNWNKRIIKKRKLNIKIQYITAKAQSLTFNKEENLQVLGIKEFN